MSYQIYVSKPWDPSADPWGDVLESRSTVPGPYPNLSPSERKWFDRIWWGYICFTTIGASVITAIVESPLCRKIILISLAVIGGSCVVTGLGFGIVACYEKCRNNTAENTGESLLPGSSETRSSPSNIV